MKEELLTKVKTVHNPVAKLNQMREYLQAFTLRSLHESEAFHCLAFIGGTALRFLYNLPRFSEDVDFSLESKADYAPKEWFSKLTRDLKLANFDAEVNVDTDPIVHKVWIKIATLMKEAGLSGQQSQKISIKVGIDTNPPRGAKTENHIVNRHFLFALQHYDLPSLMAGKIHALCTRQYYKGRDFYDLIWYCGHRPPIEPNLELLQAALAQTQKEPFPAKEWRNILLKKLPTIPWKKIAKDVEIFLEQQEDTKFLTEEFLKTLLTTDGVTQLSPSPPSRGRE